jgi:hypothetical protein
MSLPPEQRQQMIDELYAQPAGVPSLGDVGATAQALAAPSDAMIPQGAQLGPVATPQLGMHRQDVVPESAPVGDVQAVQQALGVQPQQPAPPAQPAAPQIRFAGQPGAPQAGGGFQLPPMPQQRTVKVGTNEFQPSQRNIQTQFAPKMAEETEAALAEAEQAQGEAAVKVAEEGYEAGKRINLQRTLAEGYKAGLADDQARSERDRAAQLQKYEQSYRAFSDEAAAQSKIDPDRYWANKSTGDKVMSKLAIALGALGSAITGQPNIAWEQIKLEIDNDILAQRENAQMLGRRAEQERTIYQMAQERFGDERLAELAALEEAYRQTDRNLEVFAESARTEERKAQLDALRAEVQKSAVEAHAERELAQQDKIAISEAQRFDPVRYVQSGGDPLKQLKYTLDLVNTSKALQKATSPEQAVDPSHKLYVPGLGYARTHQDAQSMRELQANFEETMGSFDEMEKMLGQKGRLVPFSATRASADSLQAQVQTGIAKSYGGIITESDLKAAARESPSITSTDIAGGEAARLKRAREKFIRRYEAHIKSKVTAQPPENVGPEPQPRAEGR